MIGYKVKGYYETDEYGEIGETYDSLRRWVVEEFGWYAWFNTEERNAVLSEVCVIVEINSKLGALIYYDMWLKKKKELTWKEFHKWVVDYINQEDKARREFYGS